MRIHKEILKPVEKKCRNFILLLRDVTTAVHIVGKQTVSKVKILNISDFEVLRKKKCELESKDPLSIAS